MALNKITYDTKVALNPQPGVAAANKVSDSDMNEIKTVVNDAIDQVNSMIESGSNTNGSYIKYVDGTMICYGEKSGTGTLADFWSTFKKIENISVTFPVEFYSTPYITLTNKTAQSTNEFSSGIDASSASSFSALILKPSGSTNTSYAFNWIAIGKWKA